MSQILHDAYCFATGFEIRPTIAHNRAWFEYERAGHTVDDLRTVIKYLKREISRGDRRPGCLKFSNLIGLGETAADRAIFFSEDLALARQAFRAPTATTVQSVQKTGNTNRTVEVPFSPAPTEAGEAATTFMRDLDARRARRSTREDRP